jgi:transketolase
MEAPSIWVWTHDSIFLGEDGPTHQPIEHLASLRAMPNLWVIRPADANEVIQAWEVALNRHDGPVALVLTRQDLPTLPKGSVERGGYVVRDGSDVTIVATGSEVSAALGASDLLGDDDISARVVSLPCWELFEQQSEEYRREVLGDGPRVSVEAASVFGWDHIVGADGMSIGIDHFGASAPAEVLAEQFGFTAEAIAGKVKTFLAR